MLKKEGGEIVNNGFTALGSGLKAEREREKVAHEGRKGSDVGIDALHNELEGLHSRIAPTGFRPNLQVVDIKERQ